MSASICFESYDSVCCGIEKMRHTILFWISNILIPLCLANSCSNHSSVQPVNHLPVPESFSPAYHLLLHSVYTKESFLAIMIQTLDRILYEWTLPYTAYLNRCRLAFSLGVPDSPRSYLSLELLEWPNLSCIPYSR